MKLTYETINLMMLLTPGLISSSLFLLITNHNDEKLSTFDKISEALIFTFLIFTAVHLTTNSWEPLVQIIKGNDETSYKITTNRTLFFWTFIYTIIFPVIWGVIVFYDYHMRLLRKLNITNKTSRSTVWDDIFIDKKLFLLLHLKDGRRLQGWPAYYSNNKHEGFIYLTKSCWIDNDNNKIKAQSTDGFLVNKENIELIEFIKYSEEVKAKK